jgi:hypothetical protein
VIKALMRADGESSSAGVVHRASTITQREPVKFFFDGFALMCGRFAARQDFARSQGLADAPMCCTLRTSRMD